MRVARPPGDKSISHRSLILTSLATGRSTIRGILDSRDVRATAAALRAIGADLPDSNRLYSELRIDALRPRRLHALFLGRMSPTGVRVLKTRYLIPDT